MFSFFEDKSYECKLTKLFNSIDNEMKDAIVYEVENEDEAKLLLEDIDKLVINTGNRYDGMKVRYVFKDIDYDRMAEQQVYELLTKGEDVEKEKRERQRYQKNMNRLKKTIDNFTYALQSYSNFTTPEFRDGVLDALSGFGPMYDAKKKEMSEEKKLANKNKVSIRQKLARFAVYNSESKKK